MKVNNAENKVSFNTQHNMIKQKKEIEDTRESKNVVAEPKNQVAIKKETTLL